VGEIYDEFDRDISGVQHKPDGALVLAGHFPSMNLSDLGWNSPRGPMRRWPG
jgi:hypothetical protein